MNTWQIVGGLISIAGTVLMFYGAYLQGQGDQKFQGHIEGYVKDQQAQEAPELVALSVQASASDFLLTVKNVGRRPATNVKVLYSEMSTPNAFGTSLIPGAREIPQNTEYKFHLSPLSGIAHIMKLPNSEPEYKEVLQKSLEKFNAGEMVFIPRFYLEYFYGGKRIVSPTYFLILESRRGVVRQVYFGKED
jgi:hypothetical protein